MTTLCVDDGNRADNDASVAVGAPNNYAKNGEDLGHVRIYHLAEDGVSWEQIGKDIVGETDGRSVSVCEQFSCCNWSTIWYWYSWCFDWSSGSLLNQYCWVKLGVAGPEHLWQQCGQKCWNACCYFSLWENSCHCVSGSLWYSRLSRIF